MGAVPGQHRKGLLKEPPKEFTRMFFSVRLIRFLFTVYVSLLLRKLKNSRKKQAFSIDRARLMLWHN
jgi:hypothetical protein